MLEMAALIIVCVKHDLYRESDSYKKDSKPMSLQNRVRLN